MALDLYSQSGVNIEGVMQDANLSTGVAAIMIDEKGHNAINIVSGAAGHLEKEDINKNLEIIKRSKIFLTQLETPQATTIYALQKAKEEGCITILNPAPARSINKEDYLLLDFFTPNENETEFYLNRKIESEQDIKDAGNEFLDNGVKNIIITLGSKGVYFANSSESYFIEALKLKSDVVDTTGAGDAFNGALCVALANDHSYKDALVFANKVGGISTTKLGAANAMPTIKEVENY